MRKVKGDRDANSCSTTLELLMRYEACKLAPLILVGAPLKEALTRAKLPVG
jgi:hypothetical protein